MLPRKDFRGQQATVTMMELRSEPGEVIDREDRCPRCDSPDRSTLGAKCLTGNDTEPMPHPWHEGRSKDKCPDCKSTDRNKLLDPCVFEGHKTHPWHKEEREKILNQLAGHEGRSPVNDNPFEPDETPEQQMRRVGRMIRENADKRAKAEGRSSSPAAQNCDKCAKPYFDPRTSTIASGSVENIQDWYCMCGTVTNLAVNTTTLAPRDSRSEAGRVKLSGVQDHADMAQIVGGELSGEELNRAYLFMHAWWKRSAKHPDRKPPQMMKIRRSRIASLLAEYAKSEGAPLPAPSTLTEKDSFQLAWEKYDQSGSAGGWERVAFTHGFGAGWKARESLTSKPELLGSGPIPPTHVSESKGREGNGAEVGDSVAQKEKGVE